MELESQATKTTYIELLVDTLRRKQMVLNQLMLLTEQQEKVISSDKLNEDEFLGIVKQKEEQIVMLAQLDDGFEKLYDSVKEELVGGKEKYADKIKALQELIANVTDISVKIQAIEKRNKSKMDMYFATRRKEIKSSRASSQTVASYYKTMAKQNEAQSYFYDKKN